MRLLVIVISSLILFSNCSKPVVDTHLCKADHIQMGTKWHIELYLQDVTKGQEIIHECWSILDTLNNLLTNYDEHSEISVLAKESGTGDWIPLSPYTIDILSKSKLVYDASQGGFDVTIGPATRVWRRAFKTKKWPSDSEISNAKEMIGMQYLELDTARMKGRLLKKGMSIDLGGIGKGYAVDIISEYIEDQGVVSYLVEGGGDLRVGASPPGKIGWTILRQELMGSSLVTAQDTVTHIAIATSGNQYQHIDKDDHRYQHHIDPLTGQAVNDVHLVVVESDLCWKSDAISTTISILGADSLNMSGYSGYMITGHQDFQMSRF